MGIHTKKNSEQGFSLIEICVVMVIVGLLVAAALMAYTVHIERQRIVQTKERTQAAVEAIAAFQAQYGFYPCPASRTDPLAVSVDCSAGAAGTVQVNPGGGLPRIRIGVMPLSVEVPSEADPTVMEMVQVAPSSNILDGYKRRLAYAVVENMAIDQPTFSTVSAGSIRITRPEGGPDITQTARYIVFSHGADGRGAFTIDGVQHEPCNEAALDGENCNDDAVFSGYMEAPRSFTRDDNNYDDVIGEAINPAPPGTLTAMMDVTVGAVSPGLGFMTDPNDPNPDPNATITDSGYLAAVNSARSSSEPVIYENTSVRDQYCRHIFGDIRCDLRLKSATMRVMGNNGNPQGNSFLPGGTFGAHNGVAAEILLTCGRGNVVPVSASRGATRRSLQSVAVGYPAKSIAATYRTLSDLYISPVAQALGVPYTARHNETGPNSTGEAYYSFYVDSDYNNTSYVGNNVFGCAEGSDTGSSTAVIPMIMYAISNN